MIKLIACFQSSYKLLKLFLYKILIWYGVKDISYNIRKIGLNWDLKTVSCHPRYKFQKLGFSVLAILAAKAVLENFFNFAKLLRYFFFKFSRTKQISVHCSKNLINIKSKKKMSILDLDYFFGSNEASLLNLK